MGLICSRCGWGDMVVRIVREYGGAYSKGIWWGQLLGNNTGIDVWVEGRRGEKSIRVFKYQIQEIP